jgi:hypothetical protein
MGKWGSLRALIGAHRSAGRSESDQSCDRLIRFILGSHVSTPELLGFRELAVPSPSGSFPADAGRR